VSVSFRQKWSEDRRNRRVNELLKDPAANINRSIRQGFFKLGRDLKAEANREILKGTKTGRVYYIRTASGRKRRGRKRRGRKRRHVSSAPGETHANITGNLRRSIGWVVTGSKYLNFGYGVDPRGPAPEYGEWLEFGTTRMKARPTLQNAIAATERNAEVYFSRTWRNIMEFERVPA
jgi:HK97 gp10 family phage protein